MDVNTLLQCDPAAVGQRVAPLLKCQGTPPTADQISSAYRSILPTTAPKLVMPQAPPAPMPQS